MLILDDYVVEVLMRDLVGHDRRAGELSGIGRIGRTVQEFGTSGSELADTKKIAHRQQGKCNGNPELHRAEVLEECTPRSCPPQLVFLLEYGHSGSQLLLTGDFTH